MCIKMREDTLATRYQHANNALLGRIIQMHHDAATRLGAAYPLLSFAPSLSLSVALSLLCVCERERVSDLSCMYVCVFVGLAMGMFLFLLSKIL